MVPVQPKFVVDENDRRKAVLVSYADWRRLMEAVEELEDIRAYDKAKARRSTAIAFEEAVRQIKSRSKR